jgi:hypothetical protein
MMAGMDTVLAWGIPLLALLALWAILARRRPPGAPVHHRFWMVAIVACAAAGAVLDVLL